MPWSILGVTCPLMGQGQGHSTVPGWHTHLSLYIYIQRQTDQIRPDQSRQNRLQIDQIDQIDQRVRQTRYIRYMRQIDRHRDRSMDRQMDRQTRDQVWALSKIPLAIAMGSSNSTHHNYIDGQQSPKVPKIQMIQMDSNPQHIDDIDDINGQQSP